MTKRDTMELLMEKLKNNAIFANCSITINKNDNVYIQAANSSTRYTIGTFEDDHESFWIRGFNFGNIGRWYTTSPYRLHYNNGNYAFNSMEEAYEYFVNFWLNYKINK